MSRLSQPYDDNNGEPPAAFITALKSKRATPKDGRANASISAISLVRRFLISQRGVIIPG
jgi:hypothetical protein